MHGWKTYTGGLIVAFCAAGIYMQWINQQQAELILGVGAALGLIGMGHKLDKIRNDQ
jgi:dethiobiotin synthetase